jgi:hypothetical protein
VEYLDSVVAYLKTGKNIYAAIDDIMQVNS